MTEHTCANCDYWTVVKLDVVGTCMPPLNGPSPHWREEQLSPGAYTRATEGAKCRAFDKRRAGATTQ